MPRILRRLGTASRFTVPVYLLAIAVPLGAILLAVSTEMTAYVFEHLMVLLVVAFVRLPVADTAASRVGEPAASGGHDTGGTYWRSSVL